MTSLAKYNKSQLAILKAVKDDLKYHLGKELDHDPQSDPEALAELENRLAVWLTDGGGGAWLRSLPEIDKNLTESPKS